MSLYHLTYKDKLTGETATEMSKKPIALSDVRKRLDRICADIEKATERRLTAAARDLSGWRANSAIRRLG
jgi:hypothetical protein